MTASPHCLIAVDIGNSRIKFGRFDISSECRDAALGKTLPIAGPALPEPQETLTLTASFSEQPAELDELQVWLREHGCEGSSFAVASVQRSVESRLLLCLQDAGYPNVRQLVASGLPLEVRVEEPQRVGIDRLLGAVAANRLRQPLRPAVVVDLGTAITVDLIEPDGAFVGGAILPGIAMSARALHEQTDALPASKLEELDNSPDAVGKNTEAAIHAGLFWGAVGAVRELIDRQSDRLTESPQIYLTGGAAPSVARLLGSPDRTVRYVPNLVLSGIALANESLGQRS